MLVYVLLLCVVSNVAVAASLIPVIYPVDVSASVQCGHLSSKIIETLQQIKSDIPLPELENSCSILETLFKQYPNIEELYYNKTADQIFQLLPVDSSASCGDGELINDNLTIVLEDINNDLRAVATSCQDILNLNPSAESGYYTLTTNNGTKEVYCDMDGANCGEGGWTLVAYVNTTEPQTQCPQGLNPEILSGKMYCGRFLEGANYLCASTTFSVPGEYSQVCGRLKGYEHGGTTSFHSYWFQTQLTIDDQYVDGVSITYGLPRKHIWTYVSGLQESNYQVDARYSCPCNTDNVYNPPPFVGNDYYCEAGTTEWSHNAFFPDDLLWDGQQCGGDEGPCCTNPNMPWFTKTLNETTNENIELRVCAIDPYPLDDVALQLIEIYIR